MSNKLRLLVDAHVFDGEFQGSRTFIENIYKEAIERFSDKVEFFFCAFDLETLKKAFGPNCHYIKLKSGNRYHRLGKEYPSIIKNYKMDWAHFQYVTPPVKACKYVVTTHDILFERFPSYFPLNYRITKHFLFKSSAKRADLLTTVSSFSKKEIVELYKIDPEKIIITHNGVKEWEERESISINDSKKPYILYLSRIEPRKNHHLLLEAFLESKLWKTHDLIIIGKESIKNKVFDKLKSKMSEDQKSAFKQISSVSEGDKWNLIKGASCFAYPSSAEGFGIPPLEAAICETPVICSNETAMSEYSFFGDYHIEPNAQSLSEALVNILKDTKLNLEEIKKTVLENYDWIQSADVLLNSILDSENAKA